MWPLDPEKTRIPIAGQTLAHWEKILNQKFPLHHPWDLLEINSEIISLIKEWDQHSTTQLGEGGKIIVGEGTKILPGVYVEGSVVIGRNCKIGPNCYLRGNTSIGDNCHVGQAVEIKNSILFDGTSVGHLSYVGDSILGHQVNFGAGTITSNLRHDGMNHRSEVNGQLIDTGRRKFGAIVGDHVHTGIHTAIYPGRKIGPRSTTRPGEVVSRDLHSSI